MRRLWRSDLVMEKRWQDRWFVGHVTRGPITIYGANAMHWAVNIKTRRWGHLCFHPSTKTFGGRWPWYFYASPNATPTSATLAFGPGVSAEEKMAALRRRLRRSTHALPA